MGGAGVWTLINHLVASVVYKHFYASSSPSLHPILPPLRQGRVGQRGQRGCKQECCLHGENFVLLPEEVRMLPKEIRRALLQRPSWVESWLCSFSRDQGWIHYFQGLLFKRYEQTFFFPTVFQPVWWILICYLMSGSSDGNTLGQIPIGTGALLHTLVRMAHLPDPDHDLELSCAWGQAPAGKGGYQLSLGGGRELAGKNTTRGGRTPTHSPLSHQTVLPKT